VTHLRKLAVLALLIAAGMLSTAAVSGWQLSSQDVRSAYFLGQRNGDQSLRDFLATYERKLPASSSGPQVLSVEFSTPYHQVVERSRRALSYSSQQAQQDYLANRDRILVTANVSLPLARVYTVGQSRIWDQFDLRLVQNGRQINPHQLSRELVYSHGEDATLVGFILRAEFSTHQVARGPVTVEVITAEKNTVTAHFDLTRLK